MQIDPMTLGGSSGLLGSVAHGETRGVADTGAGTKVRRPGDTSAMFGLDRDDFFTLFLAQLKNQDPTKPLDDKDFVAQLAQFSMIDTLNAVEQALSGTQLAQGAGLIGKHVTARADDGTAVSGVVESLRQDASGLTLVVDGMSVRPENVTSVSPLGAGDPTEPDAAAEEPAADEPATDEPATDEPATEPTDSTDPGAAGE